MGKITKVPNGPLVKKKGPFKGSTLRSGGVIKKAQNGDSTVVNKPKIPYVPGRATPEQRAAQKLIREANIRKRDSILQRNANVAGITREELRKQQAKNDKKPDVSPSGDNAISLKDARQSDCKITSKKNCGIAKEANRQNKKQRFKNGGIMKKAQVGTKVVKGSRPGLGVFRTEKKRTTSGGIAEPYKYKTESIDTTGYSKGRNSYKVKTVEGEGDKTGSKVTSSKSKIVSRKNVPSILKSLNKAKGGAMIKRADGSYSRRGLWDNLRSKAAQNKKTGAKPKSPTKAMLTQEKKIKAKTKK